MREVVSSRFEPCRTSPSWLTGVFVGSVDIKLTPEEVVLTNWRVPSSSLARRAAGTGRRTPSLATVRWCLARVVTPATSRWPTSLCQWHVYARRRSLDLDCREYLIAIDAVPTMPQADPPPSAAPVCPAVPVPDHD